MTRLFKHIERTLAIMCIVFIAFIIIGFFTALLSILPWYGKIIYLGLLSQLVMYIIHAFYPSSNVVERRSNESRVRGRKMSNVNVVAGGDVVNGDKVVYGSWLPNGEQTRPKSVTMLSPEEKEEV